MLQFYLFLRGHVTAACIVATVSPPFWCDCLVFITLCASGGNNIVFFYALTTSCLGTRLTKDRLADV